MRKPLVSVLVPIYNVEPYLRQCVASICAQALRDIEVILVDDGSTDGCGRIADECGRADARVRVMHKPNSGYGDSLNRALEQARGTWVSIVEPDDWVAPDMLAKLVECAGALEREAGCGRIDIVKAGYQRVIRERDGSVLDKPCAHLSLVKPARQPFSIDECPVLLALHPSIWSAIYRRAFLDELGIRFLPVPGAGWADNPFFVETMVAARRIAWLPEAVYRYREFEDGTLSHLRDWRVIAERWRDMNSVLRAYDVEAPAVLQAHACRGCAYLQMLEHDFDQADPAVNAAIRAMANSLDFATVWRSPFIPGEYRRAYARALPPSPRRALMLARSLRP